MAGERICPGGRVPQVVVCRRWSCAEVPRVRKPIAERSPIEKEVADLLRANPATTNDLAVLLGGEVAWSEPTSAVPSEGTELSPQEKAVRELLAAQPATAAAVAALLLG